MLQTRTVSAKLWPLYPAHDVTRDEFLDESFSFNARHEHFINLKRLYMKYKIVANVL